MSNNEILISGCILDDLVLSHNYYGENFYTTKIECIRTSGNIDILPIIVSEKLVYDRDIKGEYVFINGNIRTRNCDGHLCLYVFVEHIDILNIPTTACRIDENSINITGFLCKKNGLRKSPGGRVLVDCVLALNRQYNKSDYVPCIVWGRNANYVDGLDIGTQLNIVGRLQSRSYTKNEEIKTTYEVSVQSISEQE